MFSGRQTAWLTWEDSNFCITTSKNAFEMSMEFPLFWPKIPLGDFCSSELRKVNNPAAGHTDPTVP
jgi:hypothetical protein